jgi:HJR/Mrr/RecB family endonuclease
MDTVDPTALFPKLIFGASESIDVLVRMGVGLVKAYESNELALVDHRLRTRCILTAPEVCLSQPELEDPAYYRRLYDHVREKLRVWGWEVRVVDRRPSINCMIVDRSNVLLANLPEADKEPKSAHYLLTYSPVVATIQDHFDRLWHGAHTVDLVYEDLLTTSIPAIANRIVVASKECWDHILAHLQRHPEELFSIDPREFEELVAELLIREGMRVQLTQPSKDGGRDILAWTETAAGPHLYFVECKRYGPQKPVGVSLVRALYGVVSAENATGGLLVTTSRFTRGAMDFQRTVQNRIWLKEYKDVLGWLRKA